MISFDLICFGEVLYDIYETRKILAGAPLNTASFASFLGLKTAIISAVGKMSAEQIKRELITRNVEPFLQINEYASGKTKITLDKNKVPSFKMVSNAAYDHIQKTPQLVDLVKNTRFFYFGTLSQRNKTSRNTLVELLSICKADQIIFDVNLRSGISSWKSIVKNSLQNSTILKMNEEESTKVMKTVNSDNFWQLFNKTGIKFVFITQGEKGACMYQQNGESLCIDAPDVNVVDTTGCGDAFTAAIISGFCKNWPKQQTLKFAVNFASHVAQYSGAFNNEYLTELDIKYL